MKRRTEVPLEYVQRAVWRLLYADDAGFVAGLLAGLLSTMMTHIIVKVCAAFGLTVSEKKGGDDGC